MKTTRLFLPAVAFGFAAMSLMTGCDDDTSQIGNSLTEGNVSIYVDSLIFDLKGKGVENINYDSRSGNLLLGSVSIPGYGRLSSSFVSRMMCTTQLGVPDTLELSQIDSCQLVLGMTRGDIVGDSLAPQKVNVYKLLSQIPNNITNAFNPAESIGYENMQLLGSQSFTASAQAMRDSVFNTQNRVGVRVTLNREFAQSIFLEYKNHPETFQWPQTFASDFLPGLFVETSFGKGCIANIDQADIFLFYHVFKEKKETIDDKEVITTVMENDTVAPFAITPEVLSSNNINFQVAESLKQKVANGEIIITTPGGYNASFTFPARDIIARYAAEEHNLSLVSSLSLTIPAEAVANDYGLTAAPNLLLVKTSEAADFFKNNKLPDEVSSFTATFNSATNSYTFSTMRKYILDLLDKKEVTDEDEEFTIIPVNLSTETQEDYYGNVTATYVTKCSPYTLRPTMTRLHTEKALVVFSFSSQKFD